MRYLSRLPLETTYNTRELGGIPIDRKTHVSWHKMLRSDDISTLNTSDIKYLNEYGIDTIIDLRTPNERETTGYVLADYPEFETYFISLMISENVMDITHSNTEMSLSYFYEQLLDESPHLFKEIFSIFANPQNQGILFHCAAGKDRTGVVAALLLKLLGVSDNDIIANYEVTYSHLASNPMFEVPESHAHLVNSNREHLVHFLNKLEKDYGGAQIYLEKCGLTTQELNHIKNKYIEIS